MHLSDEKQCLRHSPDLPEVYMTVWWGKQQVNKQRGNCKSDQNLRCALEECGLWWHWGVSGRCRGSEAGERQADRGTFLCYLRDWCYITALLRNFSSERGRVRFSQQAALRGTGRLQLQWFTLCTPLYMLPFRWEGGSVGTSGQRQIKVNLPCGLT